MEYDRRRISYYHKTILLAVIVYTVLDNLQYCNALIPSSPVQCSYGNSNCTIYNSYGTWPDRSTCRAAMVKYPTTETELVEAVGEAVKKKLKVKAISRWAHSIPKLVCPDGSDGLLISTEKYDQTIDVDMTTSTVLVDSGVELRKLLDALADAGMALPYTPYWDGVSVGGLLSTGAAGSSFFQEGGAVHEYVTYMSLVVPASAEEGFAKVVELSEEVSPDELNAARVSLGVLGVISKVKFKVEPIFKRSITFESISDEDLENRVLSFAYQHEFGDVTWHPSMSMAVYRIDDRVSVDTEANGEYDFLGFRPTPVSVMETVRLLAHQWNIYFNAKEASEASEDTSTRCVQASAQVKSLITLGNGLRNNINSFSKPFPLVTSFKGYLVIGYNHKMQASGSCLYNNQPNRACPWDPRFKSEFFHQTAFAIPTSKFKDFIRDVKSLLELSSIYEPKLKNKVGVCVLDQYMGILMRFIKKSKAFLGESEDVVSMDLTYYRATNSKDPRVFEDVLEEIEQMGVFKYGAKPHWGKNRPVGFQNIWTKFPMTLDKFLGVKQMLDPQGLFSNRWTNALLGIGGSQPRELFGDGGEGCALEGLCICSLDLHCAPQHGYLCQPGRIFQEARVCRKVAP